VRFFLKDQHFRNPSDDKLCLLPDHVAVKHYYIAHHTQDEMSTVKCYDLCVYTTFVWGAKLTSLLICFDKNDLYLILCNHQLFFLSNNSVLHKAFAIPCFSPKIIIMSLITY
jgi:hypothetical protein